MASEQKPNAWAWGTRPEPGQTEKWFLLLELGAVCQSRTAKNCGASSDSPGWGILTAARALSVASPGYACCPCLIVCGTPVQLHRYPGLGNRLYGPPFTHLMASSQVSLWPFLPPVIHSPHSSLPINMVTRPLWSISAFQIATLTSYTFFWLFLAKANLCIFGMRLNFEKSQHS